MTFLLEKYRPYKISDCSFGISIMEQLVHIATYDDIPHIIISGPSGGGKKTLVNFFLEAIYDPDVNILTKCKYSVSGSSAKKDVEILRSNYHIIIEPTNTNHDKYILQEIIKQYAMNQSFNFFKTQRKFKTIVILNIENLSNNSQAALRRTMELYAKTCRFVMVCNNLSKIFDPLKSRCRVFCVPLPTREQISDIITNISIFEDISMSRTEEKAILNNCNNDLKKAIWTLDAKRNNSDPVILLDKVFDETIDLILSTISPTNKNVIKSVFIEIRSNVYALLITNIDGSKIITTIMDKLINIINNDEVSIKIIRAASECEYNLIHGRREITHIDPFIARVMKELYSNKSKLKNIRK